MDSAKNYKLKKRTVNFRGKKYRQPFWFPAFNYYILAVAAAIICYFLVWGILSESGDKEAGLPAVLVSGILFIGAVFIREIILRKAREKYLHIEKQLDFQIKKIPNAGSENKLSLKRNAEIINKIKSKSEAAEVFQNLHEGHWEVFLLCNDYLKLNKKELKTVGVGSPRLAAFRRSREVVSELHRRHLLMWAKIHTRNFVNKSKTQIKTENKLESVRQALDALKTALKYYPNDIQLVESAEAMREYRAKIKVSHWIEEAEKNAFKGNYKKARSLYRDALFYLGRENIRNDERELIAAQINSAIDGLRDQQKEISPNKD